MPATLADLFTLEQMRAEMRLPDVVDTEVDTLLPGYFEAAISWITERTRYPIFDQARSLYLPEDTAAYRRNSPIRYPSDILRNREDPIMIPLSHILSLTSVRYWTESGMRNQDPDGTISNLGRLEGGRFLSLQWPPDTGWPTGLEGMKYQFNFMRGVTAIPRALRQSIVLLAADLFNGAPEIKPTASVLVLISPFEAYINAG